MKGILGRKAGMTQLFTSDGKLVPVTVIEVKPNSVLQVKSMEKEGYNSLQLGYEDKKDKQTNKPLKGHFKKANSKPKYFVREIRDMNGFAMGDSIKVDLFNAGEFVDVTGVSKGKGFQGVIKKYGYSRGPMSHGSQYHRGVGSMGDLTSVVKKSKKLPGHMGDEQKTIQNLQIIAVDVENNALMVKGSIPGANLSYVIVKQAIKLPNKVKQVSLVDLNEIEKKNHLLEEGKKYGASISTALSIADMKKAIEEARIAFEARIVKRGELEAKAEELKITDYKHLSDEELEEAISHHTSGAKPAEAAVEVEEAKPASEDENKGGEQ